MRIVANLLCEAEWAGVDAPERIVQATSALGTLLGALAREGDTVWTPRRVDPARVAPGPGLPGVSPESGPLAGLPPAPVLAWGETRETARTRPAECAVRAGPASEHWLDVVRATRAPTVETHRAVCDRRRHLELAASVGLALPGARVVSSVEELLAGAPGLWVAKAPWSASGRERLRGRGERLPEHDRSRAERLLAAHGALVREPWCARVADFGVTALAVAGTVRLVGFHRAQTAGGGAFRGLRPLPDRPTTGGLSGDEMVALHFAARTAGEWLLAAGYEGPFGLDAWRWTGDDGAPRFHAFGELNARLTFGFVARRLAEAAGWDPGGDAPAPVLRVGTAADLDAAKPRAVLLRPGDEDPTAAWLEA